MCNLYSVTKGQAAIVDLTKARYHRQPAAAAKYEFNKAH
jgi:hypothetical protein